MNLFGGIRVENVYYMLAYAFEALAEGAYASVKSETFENAEDLFGEILSLGLSGLLKRGLHRSYIEVEEDIVGFRGRLDIPRTLSHRAAKSQMLHCVHDEFSANNEFNQILKTAGALLLRSGMLVRSRFKLKRALLCLEGVEELDPKTIRWSGLRYQKNNQHYVMLINICRFIIDGMLMGDGVVGGDRKIRHVKFDDLKMSKLYEHFICSYYAKHYDLGARAREINWAIDEGKPSEQGDQLPKMRSDVMLRNEDRMLIIDAKFYQKSMQEYWSHQSVSSANFYQIFAYATNAHIQAPGLSVAGMLLYAKTSEEVVPALKVGIAGKQFEARTLDLALPFTEIAAQLDGIVDSYFGPGYRKA